jgi:hypothetical protein
LYIPRHGRPPVAQAQKKIPLAAPTPKDRVIGVREDFASSRIIEKFVESRCPDSQPSEYRIVTLPPCS